MQNKPMEKSIPSPKELLKQRRPHLFSDSSTSSEPVPNARQLLAFALDNIASNSQEHDFELFCTQLASRAIAGNIRPQTGPTGGGDSKSDSTTYPVDHDLAARWFSATPRQFPNSRWAFAYSCKKDWATKVRSDVAGIVSVTPVPAEIYFISSQLTSDKRRQTLESELLASPGVPVHILDRTWILDQIEAHGWWQLCDYLKCAIGTTPKPIVGPEDARKKAELLALEAQLNDSVALTSPAYDLSCDYLSAALLCRSLECPREMTDGYFARAAELADESESNSQQIWIAYNRAWTNFWWHEDFDAFISMAEYVFDRLPSMNSADEVERSGNLIALLTGMRGRVQHAKRAANLLAGAEPAYRTRLGILADDASRPTTASCANLLLRTWQLQIAVIEGDSASQDVALGALLEAFDAAHSIGSVALGHYVDILLLCGEALSESLVFDAALEQVVAKHSARVAGAERARALLRRAFQFLDKHEPNRALGQASSARLLLSADDPAERRSCALVSAVAYDELGFSWAARAEFLFLLHEFTNNLPAGSKIPHLALRPAIQLCMIELRLGRPTCFLAAYELVRLLATAVDPSPAETQEIAMLDAFAGISIAQADIEQISTLVSLDATLDRLGLAFAQGCLHFAAGDVKTAAALVGVPESDAVRFFMRCADQPAATELPTELLLNDGKPIVIRTIVRGAEIVVRCSGEFETIIFGEAVLTAIESFLSTTDFKDLVFVVPQAVLNVALSSYATIGIVQVDGEIVISLPAKAREWMKDDGGRMAAKSLIDVIACVLGKCAAINDVAETLNRLDQGGAFSRASIGGAVPILLSNLGLDDYHMLGHWSSSSSLRVTRTKNVFPRRTAPVRSTATTETVVDLIDSETWNAVKWEATAYIASPSGIEIALVFANAAGGKRVFDGLAERARRAITPADAIEITFLVDKVLSRYAIQIGPNLSAFVPPRDDGDSSATRRLVFTSVRRMTFPLSATSNQILKILGDGAAGPIGLVATVFRHGEPQLVAAPVVVKSYRVVDSESVGPNDKAAQMLLDFLRKNG